MLPSLQLGGASSLLLPAPIAAPPGIIGTAIAGMQIVLTGARFQKEVTDPAPYSKFGADTTKYEDPIPSRTGMLLFYSPATIIALTIFLQSSHQNLAALLLFVHFAKRVLEVLFVHDYSGSMAKSAIYTISTYYGLATLVVGLTATDLAHLDPGYRAAALVFFSVGQAGNFYHHILLANLKTKRSEKDRRYVPPEGGLFRYCAMPHFFFEILSWLGIAFAAQQTIAFLEVASVTSQLMGRAYNTNQMYFRRFSEKEWPRSRKNLIPGIY